MAVTRADVARLAGVSPALVSYVLNGGPRPVSEEARIRIERAVQELGYRPNAIAQALRGVATETFGILLPNATNGYFAKLAEAIEDYLFQNGKVAMIGITNDDPSRELRYLQSFIDRRIDGLAIVSGRPVAHNLISEAGDLPLVIVDRVEYPEKLSTIHTDNSKGTRLCVDHLHWHGHREIACIAGPARLGVAIARVDAWRNCQLEIGIEPSTNYISYQEFSEVGGYRGAIALLGERGQIRSRDGRMPTGIFVSSDAQALGVLRACKQLGVRVPEDLALVSFDGSPQSVTSIPSLTTLAQPIDEIAKTAVSYLIAKRENPQLEPIDTILSGNLVIGESCGCEGR